MKIMNILRRKYENENAADGGDAGGANASANADKDNTIDNIDDYSNVWNNNRSDQNDDTDRVQQVQIINQQNTSELSPAEKLQAHIESLNLLDGFDPTQLGDPETASKAMQQIQANTYAAAMKDANQIITQQMDAFREEMQNETKTILKGSANISAMNKALPYSSKPQFKPVADALLTKFQEQGKNTNDSIVEVGKYFMQLQKEVSATIPNNPDNRLNGSSFNDINNSNSEHAVEENWMNFLTAK